jgi:hypothetical protein
MYPHECSGVRVGLAAECDWPSTVRPRPEAESMLPSVRMMLAAVTLPPNSETSRSCATALVGRSAVHARSRTVTAEVVMIAPSAG